MYVCGPGGTALGRWWETGGWEVGKTWESGISRAETRARAHATKKLAPMHPAVCTAGLPTRCAALRRRRLRTSRRRRCPTDRRDGRRSPRPAGVSILRRDCTARCSLRIAFALARDRLPFLCVPLLAVFVPMITLRYARDACAPLSLTFPPKQVERAVAFDMVAPSCCTQAANPPTLPRSHLAPLPLSAAPT